MARHARQIPGEDVTHFEPPRKTRQSGPVNMQPPLTPMIDVTFLLLLYFLLACQFRENEGQIPGSLPELGPSRPTMTEIKPIKIVIMRTGGDDGTSGVVYHLGSRDVGISQPGKLYGALEGQKSLPGQSAESQVLIQPRDDVAWEYVVEAFAQSVRAGFEKIGFASE